MKCEVSVRQYCDEDWPAVCAVHDAARPDELAGSVDSRAFRPLDEVAEAEHFLEAEKLVACTCEGGGGGRVVGFVAFRRPYISWLYVDPTHYRRGIGRALVREAVRRCGPDAWIHTLAGNAAAIALYVSEGFEVVKRIEDDECEGFPCTTLRLALPTSRMRDPRQRG